jgi:hypothetical protein
MMGTFADSTGGIKGTFERRIMKPYVLFALVAVAGSTISTAQPTTSELIGCVTQVPNGGLQLQASPSGSVYLLEGPNSPVQHLNQLIQVRGQVLAVQSAKKLILRVDQLQLVNQTCASVRPAQKPVAVVGEVGEGQMAVPVTTSASADQTTPGFQTEGMVKQEPPSSSRATPVQRWTSNYAPGNIAQAAQSAATADIYAASATRTEIVPGHTLGVDTMPDYSAVVENKSPAKAPRQR